MLIEYRRVMDGRTDRHLATVRAMHTRRAVKTGMKTEHALLETGTRIIRYELHVRRVIRNRLRADF